MAKRAYKPRGPKCPVCKARMHAPEGGGDAVCAFVNSHAGIIKARLKQGQEIARKKDDKKS